MTIQQSGSVTPGHLVIWTTNSVVQDGGPILASQKVLASIRSANFNTTTDQPLVLPPAINAFLLSSIIVTNVSVSLTNAQGGFYTAAQKGGASIVAPGQNYAVLTSAALYINPVLTPFGLAARFSSANLPLVLAAAGQYALAIYLSLTTAQGAPATADVYAIGIDLT
jgi:hypothetical protein